MSQVMGSSLSKYPYVRMSIYVKLSLSKNRGEQIVIADQNPDQPATPERFRLMLV